MRLAVFFPGIGYTVDKPLLHYSRRIASDLGYEIRLLPYTGFPGKVRGDRQKMVESYEIALSQAKQMLAGLDFTAYEEVLFVGKSVGTIVAAQIASEAGVQVRLILYTPLEDTFRFPFQDAIAFTGAADPWVGKEKSRIPELCKERKISCTVVPGANHSLESPDLEQDIRNLQMIMKKTADYMSRTSGVSERIIAIIKQYMTDETCTVTEDSVLKEDLGLDSFDIMNILIECEDAFGVMVTDRVLGDFITVRDMKRVITGKG